MKVKELIEKLKVCDPEFPVVFSGAEYLFGEPHYIKRCLELADAVVLE